MNKNLGLIILAFIILMTAGFWLFKNNDRLPIKEPEKKSQEKIEVLTLKGSNTVGESLAPRLAEAYLKSIGARLVKTHQLDNPVEKYVEGNLFKENKKIRIDIRAHGSSTGFQALDNQSTDIAMSSRAIKNEEQVNLSSKYGLIQEHPIALDALAIVTYPTNPIDTLTIENLSRIFAGEITNWKDIGGEDKAIHLYSRDNNSGTWDTFKSLVLKPAGRKLSETSARFESSAELVSSVTATEGSIGFVGVAYVDEAKLLNVATNENTAGFKPSGYTIGTQRYPLSRKLYFYSQQKNTSELAKSFIDFVRKNSGQKQAEAVGLISYYPTHYRPEKLDKTTAPRYRELAAIGRRITVNFANNQAEADMVKEERDIERLKNYVIQNSHRKLVLVDFSESSRMAEIEQRLKAQEIEVLDTIYIEDIVRNEDNIEVWAL
ncbi:PstS family phosphate ABC transporter substrate-binding protein [Aliikangiella sp. G2MR2-5]|uniref:PstS family phosphate ABC transporter substrate-binding protein n=1 Tax=Aliikangiella sp. G2MR2-5 TaxID=2788943 RepID=UPI0018AA3822|nr:PstS family phosphate ABC transporter substrate-binding protein [Aliikangiella sp. G2MR2-5]